MKKNLRLALIVIISAGAIFLALKLLLIRTVSYEIAGIKIPSRYNMLTGTIKPIIDYKGTANLKTLESIKSDKLGLSDEQVIIAKLRWAIFEQWVSSHRKYRGWESNPEIFRKANEDFKKQIKK